MCLLKSSNEVSSNCENCSVPKSIAGRAIARRMRSGILVGPGFCMKVRPLTVLKVSVLQSGRALPQGCSSYFRSSIRAVEIGLNLGLSTRKFWFSLVNESFNRFFVVLCLSTVNMVSCFHIETLSHFTVDGPVQVFFCLLYTSPSPRDE